MIVCCNWLIINEILEFFEIVKFKVWILYIFDNVISRLVGFIVAGNKTEQGRKKLMN